MDVFHKARQVECFRHHSIATIAGVDVIT